VTESSFSSRNCRKNPTPPNPNRSNPKGRRNPILCAPCLVGVYRLIGNLGGGDRLIDQQLRTTFLDRNQLILLITVLTKKCRTDLAIKMRILKRKRKTTQKKKRSKMTYPS